MKLRILGSSGSVSGPDNPASGYLVTVDNAPAVIMDLGPGTLGELQQIQDPVDAHVVFSHLHADHCLDFPSLLVWRRFHPHHPADGRSLCFGPADTPNHLGRLSSDTPGEVDDFSDSFAFAAWEHGRTEIVDRVNITPYSVVHPIEAFGLRIVEHTSNKVLAYSGDSAYTENLVECARDADVFLCEATWGDGTTPRPPQMHMSGGEAGRIARLAGAKKLLLTHIPPWGDPEGALRAAREEFDGPVKVAECGQVYEF
ncbi:MBL fold metallo-hydrolase [Corynebacterium halotolerans]|uniref:MBL fold metallo-hydrolase n=1 Tax=Corynebacterium halotolerans TaxID=225326 RepID=UPI003CE81660